MAQALYNAFPDGVVNDADVGDGEERDAGGVVDDVADAGGGD